MKKISTLCATWAAALLALASVAAPARAVDNVKIGVLFPLTGNAGAAGLASKAAVEVAAEIINGKHPELSGIPLAAEEGLPGLGGAKLDLVFVDHQGNPSVAQQLALRLVSQEKVKVLFGAYQSSCSLTATAVGERYGIPFVVGDSAAANVTGRGFKWLYRVTPIASDFAAAYMRFFADMKKTGIRSPSAMAWTIALESSSGSRGEPLRYFSIKASSASTAASISS